MDDHSLACENKKHTGEAPVTVSELCCLVEMMFTMDSLDGGCRGPLVSKARGRHRHQDQEWLTFIGDRHNESAGESPAVVQHVLTEWESVSVIISITETRIHLRCCYMPAKHRLHSQNMGDIRSESITGILKPSLHTRSIVSLSMANLVLLTNHGVSNMNRFSSSRP